MTPNVAVYPTVTSLADEVNAFIQQVQSMGPTNLAGICGFDGFIDTFIQMQQPNNMAEFSAKVKEAAGISASYPAVHLGDKFGGNGPLLSVALHNIFAGNIDISYVGALGKDAILPIFKNALADKMKNLFSLTDPAHSDCIEFNDGKIMLCDFRSLPEINWDRLLECVGSHTIDALLTTSSFVGAVNWGKLVNVGTIWENIALRLSQLGIPPKKVIFFMDLAEFEQRPHDDRLQLIDLVRKITTQCHTILSFNLKEAWQMAEVFQGNFRGEKSPSKIAELAAFLKKSVNADRIVIHPNDGAACASKDGCVYIPGPFCRQPYISIGAGDNFGAGCMAGALCGLDDLGILLTGVCTSGYFVRSGISPSYQQITRLASLWLEGDLPERLPPLARE